MSCPVCGKPTAPDYRPFCSRRCADVDLGRWLTEGYRIPAESEDEAEEPTENDPPPKAH
ncbi:MAG TPA: DNA gyrase inhibitor YacG [Tabrizicola sp.]|nr:DNA gyrase inhibitor YacG [Tabrizicola sp.]